MTSPRRTMDPEVRALLEEVASDPRSHLLRVPDLDGPIRFDSPVGPSAAFLASAERELLSVHRATLADLLYDATRRALLDHASAATELQPWVTIDRRVEVPGRDELVMQAKSRMAGMPEDLRAEDGFALLERCVAAAPGKRPSAAQLATAALRTRAHDGARICLAIALHQEGRMPVAIDVLVKVLDLRPADLHASIAWEQIGHMHAHTGRLGPASEAFEEATDSQEPRATPLMNLLVTVMQAGDRAAASRTAARLEELPDETDQTLEAFIQGIGRSRHDGFWSPTAESRRLRAGLAAQAPSRTRRIIDVFS